MQTKVTRLLPIKEGKVFTLYRRDPPPTEGELASKQVTNYYILHNEHETLEMAGDQLFVVLSNFNMLEKIVPALMAGQTIQEIGGQLTMQKLFDEGIVPVKKDTTKMN